jgi:hypothetical protein
VDKKTGERWEKEREKEKLLERTGEKIRYWGENAYENK